VHRVIKLLLCIFISLFYSSFGYTDGVHKPNITSKKLSDTIHIITGKGGNIVVSIGEDGTFLIDDKFAPLTDSILELIMNIGGTEPKFVINTHWHEDHTGDSENLEDKSLVIVDHENVRKRLTEDKIVAAFNMKTPTQTKTALPVVTFTKEMNFHLNNDAIELTHIPNAHTDGNSIVFFKNSNILHTGGLFFNGFYPVIDIDHGGSLKGMLNSAKLMLKMVDDNTLIIPGHGPVATKKDLLKFKNMLDLAYKRLNALKKDGKTVAEAIATTPLADLDAEWSDGIFKTDKWITLVYGGLE
jgi:glyoxylase-like metal-dependent hydrolase (beta-lactamase superfamily II)